MKREKLFEVAIVIVIVLLLGALIFGLMLGVLNFAGIKYESKGAMVAFIGLVVLLDLLTYLPFQAIGRFVGRRWRVIWYVIENTVTIVCADYLMSSVELTPLTLVIVGLLFAAFEYALDDKKP
ncbi:YrvL family regulatory protein [Brochothrix campestris]|uniref:Integral inner membrane protein n=1 Tax=Brochothrix campestris FSL F6-1037 TaxID=1265861 RepID=W7CH93_9LIST|nr:YrvL family regulatory protein [Brochothrix campestris]EUJ36312.1 integral inner membrane protein [Brochothrix campestris FSL F6-1037]